MPRELRPRAAARLALIHAIVLSLLLRTTSSSAQFGISSSIDGGVSIAQPGQQLVDGGPPENPAPTIALGLEVGGYYLLERDLGVGFAITPAFFVAGPNDQPGLNFAIGPRLMWRPGVARVTADGGLVLSSWSDLCEADNPDAPERCVVRTRPAEPAGIGFGVGLAVTFPIVKLDEKEELGTLELGPMIRFQQARYDYSDGRGGFELPVFQAGISLRLGMEASL
jgi:hypothetical protein